MIDTIAFVNGLTSDNIPLMVTSFFDELMVLYNLIGHRQDLHIHAEDSQSLATFTLLMESTEDASKLYNHFNQTKFSVYGKLYIISMEVADTRVRTIINKSIP